jgi:PIN domain nuclease of toxin-antitoxin system
LFLPREIERNNFELLPISLEHTAAVEELAPHHRDPFDRLLIAQAAAEGLSLVSTDAVFDRYGISRLW